MYNGRFMFFTKKNWKRFTSFFATTKKRYKWSDSNVDFLLYADTRLFGMIRYLEKKNEMWDRGKKSHHLRSCYLSPSSKSGEDKAKNSKKAAIICYMHNYIISPSDVTFRSRGVFEKHVEEAIFNQIGGAATIKFVRSACGGYFMQSSLKVEKKIRKLID